MKTSRHYDSSKVCNTSTTESKVMEKAEMPYKEFSVYFLHTELLQSIQTENQVIESAKCPSTDEWIKKSYVCTTEHYLSIKTNEIM
jgi:hypothetical protein